MIDCSFTHRRVLRISHSIVFVFSGCSIVLFSIVLRFELLWLRSRASLGPAAAAPAHLSSCSGLACTGRASDGGRVELPAPTLISLPGVEAKGSLVTSTAGASILVVAGQTCRAQSCIVFRTPCNIDPG